MRIRDSLSGELRELQPGADGVIGMYVCGPTVYNRIHVGNARPFVVFQLMKRYLEWRGSRCCWSRTSPTSTTRSMRRPCAWGCRRTRWRARCREAYIADTDLLGLGRPDREPLATETMAEIVALIEELIAGGHAYEAGGDVYFAVRSFDRYGMLSNQRIDQLLEGAGSAEPGEHKRDPLDFALWKGNKPGEDTWWDSPWGRGRPGWHIECSAMAERWLGREFALHGGGRDLIFPHHENEIAQSEASGRPFAQVWAHNGMLRLSGEKMSKSVGNIEPLHEAVEKWGAETLIMFLLRGHYASPIDYDDEALEQARRAAETLRNRLRDGGDGTGRGAAAGRVRGAGRGLQHAAGAGAAVRRAARGGGHGGGGAGRAGAGRAGARGAGAGRAAGQGARARCGPGRAGLRAGGRGARRDRGGRLGGARHRRRHGAVSPP